MKGLFLILLFLAFFQSATAQLDLADSSREKNSIQRLFSTPDTLNKTRFWTLNGAFVASYTGVVLALDKIWYAGYERTHFHFFNDMGEWKDMDKMGHLYTAYMQGLLASKAYRWTGLNDKQAAYAGLGVSILCQSTLEFLDGFSAKWGWSWGDVAFNTAGSLIYFGQELAWQEQRVLVKYSSWKRPIDDILVHSSNSDETMWLSERRDQLFGTSLGESILKNYNSATIWFSGNIHAFLPRKSSSNFPKWLNIAVGYGAENLYGGFENKWTNKKTGAEYALTHSDYQPYRQFFFSLDIDLSRIPVKNKFLKSLFSVINVFKIPAPTLEINSRKEVKFHALYF